MKFTSQICTTEEQSKRLLALGLKKETADCYYYAQQRWTGNSYENTGELFLSPLWNINDKGHFQYLNEVFGDEIGEEDIPYVLPAWSLHRLLEMMPKKVETPKPAYGWFGEDLTFRIDDDLYIQYEDWEIENEEYRFCGKGFYNSNLYDNIIECIEWQIKEGYFNKEYLE